MGIRGYRRVSPEIASGVQSKLTVASAEKALAVYTVSVSDLLIRPSAASAATPRPKYVETRHSSPTESRPVRPQGVAPLGTIRVRFSYAGCLDRWPSSP